jgi:hypothetical protein
LIGGSGVTGGSVIIKSGAGTTGGGGSMETVAGVSAAATGGALKMISGEGEFLFFHCAKN